MSDVIGNPNHGPLFDPAPVRNATVTVEVGPANVVISPKGEPSPAMPDELDARLTVRGRMVMEGVGQRARRQAREKVAPHLRGLRGRVYRIVQAHGPVTRTRIHEIDPTLKQGTVNARVSDLMKSKHLRVLRIDEASGEGLVEVVPPTHPEDP